MQHQGSNVSSLFGCVAADINGLDEVRVFGLGLGVLLLLDIMNIGVAFLDLEYAPTNILAASLKREKRRVPSMRY